MVATVTLLCFFACAKYDSIVCIETAELAATVSTAEMLRAS